MKGGYLKEPVARAILKQMVFGLAAMAEKKVIHRDFKLANILINFPTLKRVDYMAPDFNLKEFVKNVLVDGADGINKLNPAVPMEIKIADMGFAKKLEDDQLAQTSLGTPLNMAPEVLFHKKYDTKADVWSLGCVFYEMLTGFTPFTGVSKQNLAENVQTGEYFIPKTVKLSLQGLDFLNSCLKFDSAERLSMMELLQHPYISMDEQLEAAGDISE